MSIKALRFAAARNPHAIDQRSASNGSLARIAVEMQAYRNRLFAEREQIGQRIAGLDSAMQAIGGSAAPKSSGRKSTQGVRSSGGRPGSLKAFISNVLRSRARPIGPHEIAQAVRTAGYKTKAKDLTNAVGNALAEMKSVKRVGYGLYRA
ncbi:MAG: hypothetical protein HY287_12955 [Planctomycetes bacterium]|nr:hypothetical protein [Planctomycetota bacterium]MBI3835232.1 hypothetical protein [Planctomycetota bacterium]